MLRFRCTCAHHQDVFVAAARRGGCFDLGEIDVLRQKTLARLSAVYPRAVLDHFNEESCLGCKLEAGGIDLGEIERLVTGLARELCAQKSRVSRDA